MLTYMRMLEGSVTESKKLGCFGASYLYPILMSIGICGNKTKSWSIFNTTCSVYKTGL